MSATDPFIVKEDGVVLPPMIFDEEDAAYALTTNRDNMLLPISQYCFFYPYSHSPELIAMVQSKPWKNMPLELWLEALEVGDLLRSASFCVYDDDEDYNMVNDRCLFEGYSKYRSYNHLLSLFGCIVLRELIKRETWTFSTYEQYWMTIASWSEHLVRPAALMRGIRILVDPYHGGELDFSLCYYDELSYLSDNVWIDIFNINPATELDVMGMRKHKASDYDDETWIINRDITAPMPWVERRNRVCSWSS